MMCRNWHPTHCTVLQHSWYTYQSRLWKIFPLHKLSKNCYHFGYCYFAGIFLLGTCSSHQDWEKIQA